MTTTFPPKPWQEGATFTNETTGVGYTYSGGKWLASGGPKVEGEYLPLTGGDMLGNIRMDFDTCIDGRNADGQNYRFLQFKGGQGLDYKAATNNEYNVINRKALEADLDSYMPLAGDSTKTGKINLVANSGAQLTVNKGSSVSNAVTTAQVLSDGTFETVKTSFSDTHLVTKKYTDQAIKDAVADAPTPSSPFRKFKYAGDRSWGNMRPGEFQMLDKDQNITNELDKCQAIIFKGEDADGNRAVRDENRISYQSWGGSALNILNSGQTRLYFRAPIGMLEYGVDIDCYSLWWQELDAGAKRTSTFTKFTNAQTVYLQCADLFF